MRIPNYNCKGDTPIMNICYYPGCTLKTQATELDRYARACAAYLGITMNEIEDWQCCGGVYQSSSDEIATKLSAIRALDYAKHNGGRLLTLCSACHNVIKRTNYDMRHNEDICRRANNYLALDGEYRGETEVIHYLEMLRDIVGFDKLKAAVVNPIGEKIGAYYGCLLLRPGKEMAFDDTENPSIMEDFISAIGGKAVKYSLRNECCGAYVGLKDNKIPLQRSRMILENAKSAGAQMIVTACPLCQYNLTKNGDGILPVKYFTELLAQALGVSDER